MNAEKWKKVKPILEEVLEILPESRSEFLKNSCKGDEDLELELEKLISLEQSASDLLEQEAVSVVLGDHLSAKYLLGEKIGNYRIIDELGSGGMGTVYLAERADGAFEQKVAIKIIKRGMNTDAVLRRFFNERQILASLEHPNIAHLIDGGSTQDDLPYIVMEYVKGENIIEFAKNKKLDLEARLDLFRKVCGAVSFAHQNLIIHRDLKPSNIIVTKEGIPKLLDFGIAKLLNIENANQTATQHFAFTPEYASPEQVRGENLTTATDIYSLGIILYELLTEIRPFSFDGKNFGQIMQMVTQSEPICPSVIQNSKFKIQNSKLLRGDLDNIVLKALRKEPERRYFSVEQFSEDIRRHLKGLPILARQDSNFYRTEKFIRRNTLAVAVGVIAFLFLIGGIFAVIRQANIADSERAKAERRFNDVRQLANSMIFEVNGKIEESPIKARELLVKRAVEYLDKLALEAQNDESLQAELASAYEKIGDVQAEHFGSSIGETVGALETHRKALQIRKNLLATAPDNLQYSLNLANSYLKIADLSVTNGKTQAALENYQNALSIIEIANRTYSKDTNLRNQLARTYAKTGQGILRSGSISKALENYEKATAIMKLLAAENPNNIKFRHSVSVFESYTGYAKMEIGKTEEAFKHFSEAFQIDEQILQDDKDSVQNRQNAATAELWFGVILRKLERFEESRNHLQNTLKMQKDIYETDKSNVGNLNSLADSHLELGWTFSDSGNSQEAIGHFEKAIELYENVAETDKDNISALRQISFTRRHLADSVRKKGDIILAGKIYEKALHETEIINQKDEQNSEFQHDKAVCLLRLAEINKSLPTLNQAIQILKKLAAESPEHIQRQKDLQQTQILLLKLA